ncbi:hypothetical protein [Endozoicomonas sp. SCSIO W0465]|uniref:hypothetical protein n=1 Tax=Endozoicomonas sp. SCSIO W0465 TaxID=2918516 RepID=UPI0020763407|nr:hypothetical protein [Endozoicomonas sp. SCSIO W0465]USE38000.1 hypothetical protein MJO57_07420 [Endozoicomonas sp. SCSIO W0465]
MKVIAVAVAGMLLAGIAQAADQVEDVQKQGMVCYSMGSVNSERQSNGRGMAPDLSVNVAPAFYITSDRDYKACRKVAAEKGAHVIIDPNA